MKSLRDTYIKIRNRVILWNNKRRTFIKLEIRNKIPRLIVHDKYENTVKWILRILTMICVASSVVSLPWHLSLILSIFLLFIEQIIEKIIFTFTSLFVQPIPIGWDPNEWLGAFFVMPNLSRFGIYLKSEKSAKKIFKCIRSWNYNQDEDIDNNINISFIIESDSEYSMYIYPSPQRKLIKLSKENISMEMLKKRQIKEHNQLIMMMILCKPFSNPQNSHFRLFKSHYRAGDPFEFGVGFIKGEKVEEITSINPVLKSHLKIKSREELTESDIEYHHGRIFMSK